jgi:hypothetical protein
LATPLRRQPGAHRTEADDEVAVVAHLRRHDRELEAAALGEKPELVLTGRHADRRRAVAPAGQQRIQRLRLDHRAGEDVRADGRGLLDHADRQLGLELLEADRQRQSGRTGADYHHVVFHELALAHRWLSFVWLRPPPR